MNKALTVEEMIEAMKSMVDNNGYVFQAKPTQLFYSPSLVSQVWENRSPLDKPWEKEIDFNE